MYMLQFCCDVYHSRLNGKAGFGNSIADFRIASAQNCSVIGDQNVALQNVTCFTWGRLGINTYLIVG